SHLQLRPGDLKVCLVYPGEKKAGLSSLGIQRVYAILNSLEGVSCDLYFLDSETSLFLGWELTDFDVVAFSVTYEDHLFGVIKVLKEAGIPPLREERGDGFPLVLGGGIGLYYNPVPFFPVLDAVYLGEAEGRIEDVFISLLSDRKLSAISAFDNVMISQSYRFGYAGEVTISFEGERKKIYRSKIFPVVPSHSCFLSGETAFSEMFLMELNRGCTEKCRFCVASYMGLPYREKEISVIEKEVEIASRYVDRVGLIGAGVTDYSKMEELYRILKRYGVKASFSSMKASSKSDFIFKILEESGQRTVTIAPEAGSERLRFAINKKVRDETYFSFAEEALRHGAENLKLYFLIGLPTEEEEDLKAIARMVKSFREIALPFWRERKRAGEIHVSVNPVIAKPFTPFQWYGLNRKSVLEKKLRLLSRELSKIPGVRFSYEGVREAVFQAVVSRGDTRVGEAAVRSVTEKISFRKALKDQGLDLETLYSRERERDELFPWEVVDSGIRREYLWKEYRKTYEGEPSPVCFPGCRACGLC
ncbi:MAG: radical SAM protein, partial [Desulfurobacteriaceae bacterium]